MNSRTVCKGRCNVCGLRACVHPVRHGGPHQCAFHVTVFINSIYSFGDNSLKNWLGDR